MRSIAVLENPIMNYAWGSLIHIPDLIGRENQASVPYAEMWMGAHTKASSIAVTGTQKTKLIDLIDRYPNEILGDEAVSRFNGRIPYLFKVLAAANPLSIQAHPDKEQAMAGFLKENKSGLSLTSPERNYKDSNHKPECICALTSFSALCGFRNRMELIGLLEKLVPTHFAESIRLLKMIEGADALRQFFSAVMRLSQKTKSLIIHEALTNAQTHMPQAPVTAWMKRLSIEYPDDIGILAPVLLNFVQLQPGEALYLPAGELHAYLEGMGLEIMANSDNVLRGALTRKHVDVPELIRILTFKEHDLQILKPIAVSDLEKVYPVEAEEFVLSRIELSPNRCYQSSQHRSVEILLVVEGQGRVNNLDNNDGIAYYKGRSFLIPAGIRHYQITGTGIVYKAAVPLQNYGL